MKYNDNIFKEESKKPKKTKKSKDDDDDDDHKKDKPKSNKRKNIESDSDEENNKSKKRKTKEKLTNLVYLSNEFTDLIGVRSIVPEDLYERLENYLERNNLKHRNEIVFDKKLTEVY